MDTSTAEGFKQARRALGLTQKALAKVLKAHPMTISRFERGGHPIPPVFAYAIKCLVFDSGRRGHKDTTQPLKTRPGAP